MGGDNLSVENDFYTWLSARVSPVQLSNMYTAFAEIDDFCLNRKILERHLFETVDEATIVKVKAVVDQDQAFGFTYKNQRKVMSLAMQQYLLYIREKYPQVKTPVAEHGPKTPISVSASGTEGGKELSVNRIKYLTWLKGRGITGGKAISYLSILRKCGDRATELGLLHQSIFSIVSPDVFRPVRKGLLTDSTFVIWDRKNNNVYSSVVDSYALYLKNLSEETSLSEEETTSAHESVPAKVETAPLPAAPDLAEFLKEDLYAPLLQELTKQGVSTIQGLRELKLWPFMNRYNLYSIATRQLVLEKIQEKLALTNPSDSNYQFILICGEKEYKAETASETYLIFCEEVARKYPLKFRSLIGRSITLGGSVPIGRWDEKGKSLKMTNPQAYIDAELNTEEVLERVSWICSMCMGNVPPLTFKNSAEEDAAVEEPASDSTRSALVLSDPVVTENLVTENTSQNSIPPAEFVLSRYDEGIIKKMEQIVLAADIDGISLDEVKDELGITMVAARRYVRAARNLVEIKGKLYHEEAFVDWDEGAQKLEALLEKLIQKNNGYVSAAQLYEYAKTDMRMFLSDNDLNDERSVYEIAQHLFEQTHYHGKSYVFTGKMHISSSTADISSNFDIYCKYAEDQGGVFALDELTEYLTGIGIKAKNLRGQLKLYSEPEFFYYEPGILIYAKSMSINENWHNTVRSALSRLFADVGDHIILREIQPVWFDQLPWLPGGRSWTPMLLQSILKFWGDDLGARTIIAMETQNIETLHAMLVQTDSPIQNFGDVVVSYLLENDIEQRTFDAEELRMLLLKSKMIQGNELIYNMPKALGGDERFSWDVSGNNVTVLV